jgi:hypothetical protein
MSDHAPLDPGRRDALRKLLAGAAVASAAPVVSTFFAPAGAALTSQRVNRFQLNRNGSGANALQIGALAAANTDATGQGCIPTGWAGGTDTVAGDGVTGSVTAVACDRNNDGDFVDTGESGAHITANNDAGAALYGTADGVTVRNLRVTTTVTLPAGCRFDIAPGFPTAATASMRATILRNGRGPDALDSFVIDDPTTFGAVQCVPVTISGVSGDGRTATLVANFVERRVYDDDILLDDWATYKINDIQLRIAAYCNL